MHPIGQVLCVALEGTKLSQEERDFFLRFNPSGVTLFSRNIPQQLDDVHELSRSLQAMRPKSDPPLIIAIDQEGGRVDRFRREEFPNFGPPLNLFRNEGPNEALRKLFDYGFLVGTKLLSLGINVNFAPVCDLNTEPTNTAIGDRCFGESLVDAAPRAMAFLKGMQSSGVKGCLKHFPGQGDARADTHLQASEILLDRESLFAREIQMFKELISESELVMMSHCVYPKIDNVQASLSHVVIKEILRLQLGFNGVVISDDMTMQAVDQSSGNWEQQIVHAILAGTDIVLICRDIKRCEMAALTLQNEFSRSTAFRQRCEDSILRVRKFRKGLLN